MKDRVLFIDYLRAICVLYIVGYWHLFNYTDFFPGYNNPISLRITIVVLGLFTFLSGYLLARSDFDLNTDTIKKFFVSRFLRIYPLYILTLCLFVYSNLTDKTTALKAALLASMFYAPSPPTLWFIAMLLIYYLTAPILLGTLKSSRIFGAISLTIALVFLIVAMIFPVSDTRLAIYFPAFALGMYCAKISFAPRRKQFEIAASLLVAASCFLLQDSEPEKSLTSIGIATLGPALIFLLCDRYKNHLSESNLIAFISFSGFAMYLLHRPIFELLKNVFFPYSGVKQTIYLIAFCLPVIAVASWIVQRAYDSLLNSVRAS